MAPTVLVNEVLAYVFHATQVDHTAKLQRTVLDFYDEPSISTAKQLLWERYHVNLDPSYNTDRNNRGRSKKEKEVDDILDGLKDIEKVFSRNEDLPVVFAAVNLTNLPPADNVHVNNNHVHMDHDQRLKLLELQMIEVLQSRATTTLQNAVHTIDSSAAKTIKDPEASKHDTSKHPTTTPAVRDPSGGELATIDSEQSDSGAGEQPPKDHDESELDKQKSYAKKLTVNLDGTKWKTIHGRKRKSTPVYGNRKGTKLMAGPRQYDLFVFRVNRDSGVEDVSNYIKETDDTISVVDSYCLTDRTKDRATHSYKVTIRCDDVSNILSANFWPDRIGCRLFEKRSRDPATPVPKKDNNGDQA